MTFKGTSESLNHINRVASASTRERANGRIDMIPKNAREPEEYYNSVLEQYRVLREENEKIKSRIEEVQKLLAKPLLPYVERIRLSPEQDILQSQRGTLESKLEHMRQLVRKAGEQAWAELFHSIAKTMLEKDQFIKINNEVERLLGRKEHEVHKSDRHERQSVRKIESNRLWHIRNKE
jgi:hypothetical protein